VLYLSVTGALPFSTREPKELVKKIRARQYIPIEQHATVPDELASLVARLLSPDPAERPQRGQSVVSELNEIARNFRIESSGPRIAEFLATTFPEEIHTAEVPRPLVQELVMNERPSASTLTPKLASGSIPTARPSGPLSMSHVAPSVAQNDGVSDTAVTMIVGNGHAPPPPPSLQPSLQPLLEPFAERSSSLPAPLPAPLPTDPPAPATLEPPSNALRLAHLILAIAIVLALAIGMYVFLRPS